MAEKPQHALITGAGSGIGEAIARRLVDMGFRVILAGRREQPLSELASDLGKSCTQVVSDFDVTDPRSVAEGIEKARAFGEISVLINNAGEAPSASFEKTTHELWAQVVAVNLTGLFNVTQAVFSDLRRHGAGARIINIASTAGLKGYAYTSAYSAAKHGVIGLTRALALELARTGVTVNAVCPGFTDTPLLAKALSEVSAKTKAGEEQVLKRIIALNPQGRLVLPTEVADAVSWLVSPQASAITGQAIVVAGGEVMAR